MFGVGLPVTLQNTVVFDPSRTVRSPLTLVSLTGTKNGNTILLVVIRLQHSVWCWFGSTLLLLPVPYHHPTLRSR